MGKNWSELVKTWPASRKRSPRESVDGHCQCRNAMGEAGNGLGHATASWTVGSSQEQAITVCLGMRGMPGMLPIEMDGDAAMAIEP